MKDISRIQILLILLYDTFFILINAEKLLIFFKKKLIFQVFCVKVFLNGKIIIFKLSPVLRNMFPKVYLTNTSICVRLKK